MTTTIAISSQKGGVAKTTTCLSLGASLAERNISVLLIDMDPQANLTMSFGIEPELQRHTVGDALLDQNSLVAVSHEGPMLNLDLVPANHDGGDNLAFLDGHTDFIEIQKGPFVTSEYRILPFKELDVLVPPEK